MAGFKSVDGFDANASRYTNGASAVSDTDLPTFGQIKQLINDISSRRVKVAATSNVNLAAPGTAIDGVTLAANDRFLAPSQTDATQNGIYVWNGSAAAATRATDANTGALLQNVNVFVDQGTTYGDKRFRVITDAITIGTTSIVISQQADAGAAITDDGTTIQVSGNIVSLRAAYRHLSFIQAIPASAGPYQYAHGFGAIPVDVHLQELISSQWYTVGCGGLSSDATNIYLTLPGAPAAGQYRVAATS